MGTWSVAIFGNDLALDVRGDYRELLQDGVAPLDAQQRILDEFAYASSDPDNQAAFWTALAATQMQVGRLDNTVRDRTIEVIDNGADLHLWHSTEAGRRKAVLEKLRAKLLGPQREPVKLRRPKREPSPVQAGDTFLLGLPDGREARFRTLAVRTFRFGDVPIVEMIDERGRPFRDGIRQIVAIPKDVKEARIQIVGRTTLPRTVASPDNSCGWRALAHHAASLLSNPDAYPKRGLFR